MAVRDDRYHRIPKVELHCHVEGTVRPATVVHLAAKAGRPLPVDNPTELYRYDSLDSFLAVQKACTMRIRLVFAVASIVATTLLAACASTVAPSQTSSKASAAPHAGASEAASATPLSLAPTHVDWTTLSRPLHLPRLAADSACPRSSARTVSKAYGPALGDGPVYPVGSIHGVLSVAPRDGRYSQKVLWVSSAAYQGPVLVRGARLDGPGVVQFAVGYSEPLDEFRLMEPGATSRDEEPGWREWPSYTVVPQLGCYAYQVDGLSFSTVVVFEARAGA